MKKTHKEPQDLKLYLRLLKYVKPYTPAFLIHILGFMAFSGAGVGYAHIMQLFVDALINQTTQAQWYIPITIMSLALIRGLGGMTGNYFLAYVTQNVIHTLRCQIFNHLIYLPVSYFNKSSSGQLITKVTYHVNQVTFAASDALKVIVREGLFVIGLASYLVYQNWKLSLVFVVITPAIALVVLYAGKRFRTINQRIQDTMGNITQVASEAIQGQRIIKIFNGHQYEKNRFHQESDYNKKQALKLVVTNAASTATLQLLVTSALAILICFAFLPSQMQQFTPGQFVAFFTAAGMLAKPLRQLSETHSLIQKGLAAAQDLFALLDEPTEPDTGKHPLKKAKGEIAFKQVSFAYQNKKNVLKDITFKVEPGKTIALVGSSGSGKSTLINLIPRFHPYQQGEILLDGTNINDYKLKDLRQQITLVSQQTILFNDTIFNNITYGTQKKTEKEVLKAAKAAHALEFIQNLPEGLDTLIGDNGILLSGGQRQRVAIARAILKNAPILILDEATSALDVESERHIQTALEELMKNRTTLVIAHRLSTVEKADEILVIEKGKITERGNHQQLLTQNKRYAELYKLQFQA